MADLIVMLTKDDETVPNAKTLFEKIRHLPFHGIGFKDVGIGWPEMKDLAAAIKQTDKKFYFEIVSEGVMKNSVQKALNLKADVIMGGNYDETISKAKKKAEYYPYVGKFSERPCQLYGKIEEIVKETKMIANKEIEGITLLAYRHSFPEKLLKSICQHIDTKLIVAGSVDSKKKITEIQKLPITAFTIGTALIQNEFPTKKDIVEQIKYVLKIMGD